MPPVLVFFGRKFYPEGGAADLKATLPHRPNEQELMQIFVTSAAQEDWLPDDYWMQTLELGEGAPAIEYWLVFIRERDAALAFKEADYATATVEMGSFKVLFVPVTERVVDESVWIGPRDFPDITFY